MRSSNQILSSGAFSAEEQSCSKGLRISRFFGRVTAVGLLLWLWVMNGRLSPNYPHFMMFLNITGGVYALFLLMPWSKRLSSKMWWGLFLSFIGLSMILAIGFVGTVAYEQAEAIANLKRARPPIAQGILIFLCLLQVPTLFFDRMEKALR